MSRASKLAKEAGELAAQIGPMLYGHAEEAQSAALAELLAMWIAGHFADNDELTRVWREELLAQHIEVVRRLVAPCEAQILDQVRRGAS